MACKVIDYNVLSNNTAPFPAKEFRGWKQLFLAGMPLYPEETNDEGLPRNTENTYDISDSMQVSPGL